MIGPAYVINLADREDRKSFIKDSFSKHNVTNFEFFVAHNGNDLADGSYGMSNGEIGCSMSHLSAIQYWLLAEPEQENLLILEDDVSLDGMQYWNWTWDELVSALPKDYDIVHLSCNGSYIQGPNEYSIARILKKDLPELFTTAYIISRAGAQKIVDKYVTDDGIVFNFNDKENVADNMLLYGSVDNAYKLPLFFSDAEQFVKTSIDSNDNDTARTVTAEVREHTLSILKYVKQSGRSISDILKIEE